MTVSDPPNQYFSAEFRLESPGILFRFKLRRTEKEPLFALVPENSRSLVRLKEGSLVPMTFYHPDKTVPPVEIETRIKYLRTTGTHDFGNQVVVGLDIDHADLN